MNKAHRPCPAHQVAKGPDGSRHPRRGPAAQGSRPVQPFFSSALQGSVDHDACDSTTSCIVFPFVTSHRTVAMDTVSWQKRGCRLKALKAMFCLPHHGFLRPPTCPSHKDPPSRNTPTRIRAIRRPTTATRAPHGIGACRASPQAKRAKSPGLGARNWWVESKEVLLSQSIDLPS